MTYVPGSASFLSLRQSAPQQESDLRVVVPELASFQRPVEHLLEAVVGEMRRIVRVDFPRIEEVNDYLLSARGKLFRPTLLLLSSQVGGRRPASAVTLAAVVELAHLATLVHDDAIDHSVLRRGMPTVNALWDHQTAVIMGDYLVSRAIQELAVGGLTEAVRILVDAANTMSIGEMRQLAALDVLELSQSEYYQVIGCKTASLMGAACEMGAVAGVEEYREQLAGFGNALGMAFQITDDLLDYTGSEAVTGKPSGHDLREHKVTLPLIAALREMSPAERSGVERFFADPQPTDDAIAEVVELVQRRGGLECAQRCAEEQGERALRWLVDLPEDPAVDALRQAVSCVMSRNH